MYHDMMFMGMGKEINANDASQHMGRTTEPFFLFKVKISDWRHLNIGMKKVHCQGLIEFFQQSMPDGVHAIQGGHSEQTEQQIYAQLDDIMSSSKGNMIHVFVAASVQWQVAVRVPPGGLGLTYQSARTIHFDRLVEEGVIKVKRDEASDLKSMMNNMMAFMERQEASHEETRNMLLNKIDQLEVKIDRLESRPGILGDPTSSASIGRT